jgi:hypothetical protein
MNMKIQLPLVLLIFIGHFILSQCGRTPGPFPPDQTGHIRVTVMDTSLIDSVFIELDDIALGQWSNPAHLENIVAGFHQLFVYNTTSAGTTKGVDVRADQTVESWFWLTSVSPHIGFQSPDFEVEDLGGDTITLEGLRGKVVILAFFEFT